MTEPKAQAVVEVLFEARTCPGIPTDCCDYGVISHATGKEICRVWTESDARLIADLLNTRAALASTPPTNAPSSDYVLVPREPTFWMAQHDR